MCLPVILESIGHGESKQSLLFTVYFPSFFFRPYSFQPSWGNLQLEFRGRTVERQSCILCCLLPQGTLLWPGLQRAFWRRLPPPQRSPRWPHQNHLLLHHIKPAFPFGLRSCSWQMNQCAISLKTNASPEFKDGKRIVRSYKMMDFAALIFFPPNLQQYALAVKCSKNNKRISLNTIKK